MPKIKKFNDYKTLRYSIFDWDDNILYMPSVVHLDIFRKGKWVPVDIPNHQFHEIIATEKTRMRDGGYQNTFEEMSDIGPRGNKAFLLDTIEAVKNRDFGPSWDDFIYSIVDGRIFLIITARGHEPQSIRKSVKWIIKNYLSDEQKEDMKENLSRFHELFGDDPKDVIEHYLDNCDYVGVMSDYFKETFKVPDMKISQLVGYGKSLVIKRFLNRIREYSRKLGLPAKVGFSDDRKRTVDDVIEFLSGEKSLDEPIEYYVFDTSGKEKKKMKL